MKRARILIIDDEPAIVQLASDILKRIGYEVAGFTSPRDALEAAADHAQFDLVLSDVLMPELKGPDLIRKIREASPEIAAVLMSGFTNDGLPADIPLVEKPFSADRLQLAIDRALGRRGKPRHEARG